MDQDQQEWRAGILKGGISFYDAKKHPKLSIRIANKFQSYYFPIHRYGSKAAAEQAAKAKQMELNQQYNLYSNNWRPDPEGGVQVQTTQDQVMFVDTDVHETKLKNTRIWAVCHDGHYYARACVNGKYVPVHRLVAPELKIVDHFNGETMDNRRANLREGSGGVNQKNQAMRVDNASGHNGIGLYPKANPERYRVHWYEGGKQQSKSFNFTQYQSSDEAKEAAIAFRNTTYARIGSTNGQRPCKRKRED